MVKILSSVALLICIFSGTSASLSKSALDFQQTKDSAQRTLSNIENFPEPPNCGIVKTSIVSDRIHGGVQVEPHALPWMVFLSNRCGGTLINSRWVLTAAHCLRSGNSVTAFINAVDCDSQMGTCDSNARKVEISKQIKHPGFRFSVGHHDIALMQLKDEVKFNDKIQPICLPHNDEASGSNIFEKEAHVSGWGTTEHGFSSKHLLKVLVNIWDSNRCHGKIIKNKTLDKLFQVCAGGVAGEDACKGDSGGPLYMQLPNAAGNNTKEPYYQVGIVSFGEDCGREGYPGVYTNVANYIPWIRETILSN